MEETFLYQESRLSIVIEMYHNGWPALSLKDPVTHEIPTSYIGCEATTGNINPLIPGGLQSKIPAW